MFKDYDKIKELESSYIINTYGRNPEKTPLFVEGKGCILHDEEGNEYLDLLSGLGVNNLGHSHPGVVEAATKQMNKLLHTSNLYYTVPQVELSKLLIENSFADKVFFANSGAESNEAAIKLARKYSELKYGENRKKIITVKKSFHGRTLATLTATGQEKVRKGFGPLPEGFSYVPLNDIDALKKEVDDKTCAVMIEPILGEGGVHPCEKDYLEQAKELCKEKDILLIYDEIQTGMGRTAKLFAHEHYGVTPDVMTLAKALGGGLPIGAMLCTDEVAKSFSPGDHASTFGGNPVAAEAGVAVVNTLLEDGFLENVQEKSSYFVKELEELALNYSSVQGVRHKGMMIALQVDGCAGEILGECLSKRLLINAIGDSTIRLLPPLVIEKNQIDIALGILENVIADIES
ncbi:aspartate aminotransferase family protein [Natranaerofaba carboxydovora]|uniref:aspartate aminotransferase family protein n=1 Tax=Natranaerofaba carboxydovora TaxID=2742683 RepID=UPI001F137F0A|nr:aspartate aminotransferase family protein [Natranaerofaba carboxydovora]UMZ74568.1 Acetylornithine aminotransferase [Natranaerofaba carboxydovora]